MAPSQPPAARPPDIGYRGVTSGSRLDIRYRGGGPDQTRLSTRSTDGRRAATYASAESIVGLPRASLRPRVAMRQITARSSSWYQPATSLQASISDAGAPSHATASPTTMPRAKPVGRTYGGQ